MNAYLKIIISFILVFLFTSCNKTFQQMDGSSVQAAEIKIKSMQGVEKALPFLFSVPKLYDPSKKYPLLIALHGYGSNSQAFHEAWKPAADSLGVVLLVPQGENPTREGIGYTWGENTEMFVMSALDFISQKVNIDLNKIMLAGFSMGGGYTYEIATKHPLAFKSFAALNSSFHKSWLGNTPPARSDLKAYISHGELETEFSKSALEAKQEFEKRGYNTRYVVYPGIGHHLPEPVEDELIRILTFLLD